LLPLTLACDASPYKVGGVIAHVMPSGEEKPIAFDSRTLSKAEQNYAQLENEALAIIFGIKKFHQYIYGRNFCCRLITSLSPQFSVQKWAYLHLRQHVYKDGPSFCRPITMTLYFILPRAMPMLTVYQDFL